MKKRHIFIIVLIVLVAVSLFLLLSSKKEETYQFKGNSFYYSEHRGKTNYEILLKNSSDSLDFYKVTFKSRNFLDNPTIIYEFLFMPKDKKNVPGIVLLPGGGGSKEQESKLASKIANLGYAVLTIDQRGIGETGGVYLNPEQDYQIFLQKKEPIQHLSVYDALRSYDVLSEIKEVDKTKIGFMGESMGARYAIIAAAIEKKSKGVIAISTSGFHIETNPLQPGNDYLLSIDPDHYISNISPRFVMMLHGTNDSVVFLTDAQKTFDLAKEPKEFFAAEDCNHGYCEKMWDNLTKGLKRMME